MTPSSRRDFLRVTVGAAAAAGALPAFPAHGARKPNLLFLWTDEQRPDTIAVYGNRRIQAPNLSKLASESMVFRNAYDTQPVCTPARSSILTGLWPHQNGCTQNNVALAENVPTLPKLMGDADYRTGYFGKWHLGDEVFAQHGFEEWRSIEDGYWKYYREGRDANARSSYSDWLRVLNYTPDTSRGDFSRDFASRLPIEHCKPSYLGQEACDFLRRHRDEPFILHVNYLEPHMPFWGPLNDLHKLEDIQFPPNFEDPLEENEPMSYRFRAKKYAGMYDERFDLAAAAGWRRLIANYWGLVSQIDRSVGGILTTLEELGLAEDTIVVFTSDHGDMMGSHHLVEKGYMYQEAMRVPLLIRAPGQGRKQQIVEGHVSQIDLVPTLLDLMGGKANATLPGKSLVPLMKGETQATEPVFVEWNAPAEMPEGPNPEGAKRDTAKTAGPSSRAVIMPDGWKLVLHDKDQHQLYNLEKDSGETKNMYGERESREVVTRLSGEIQRWQERVGDTLRIGEGAVTMS
ncbi:MAG: sulfatase-like hydrolase/transferase [Candidatus Hydrogenedentes bacterium]|nr:sulfatase-like hydrolase/transferase [Candidatus Hydrogenedentota bacterium]